MTTLNTGQTIYETIISVDRLNNPVLAPNFSAGTIVTLNGEVTTGTTVAFELKDSTYGIFMTSWSADTYGTYQITVKNAVTNVIYVSDNYRIVADSDVDAVVYVGI